LDLKSDITDDERDFMSFAFLAFQDASHKNGIDAEKIASFTLIEGARTLAEARGVLMTLRVFKLIAADLVTTKKRSA
jgi:hypothetical protein